jgi:hypothetical protein
MINLFRGLMGPSKLFHHNCLSWILCGCSVAHIHIFCLLTISSKQKWVLSENHILWSTLSSCIVQVVKCSLCPLFSGASFCCGNRCTSECRIHWSERHQIPTSLVAFVLLGLYCMAAVRAVIFPETGRTAIFVPKLNLAVWTAASVCMHCF